MLNLRGKFLKMGRPPYVFRLGCLLIYIANETNVAVYNRDEKG